jgi:hypothetical protein
MRSLAARSMRAGLTAALLATLAAGARGDAQESGAPANAATSAASATSRSAAATNAVAGSPVAALRDALFAACSQSHQEFSKFLTARNAETFAQLMPGARVALMKRFVLLNEPGKPSVITSVSGRPVVRCQTPEGAAELQIGGADASDNLAFLPVEVRDVTDTVGASAMHVKMGLVRENGEWKLLSVGLVLLDLPSLAAEWDAAEMQSTEQEAIEGLKKIAEAVEAYRQKYTHLPESLEKLGAPTRGSATVENAGLLDAEFASGAKNGYTFRYVIMGAATQGAPAKFELAAAPQTYGRTGRRSFFRDSNGGLHAADRQGAVGSASDPKIE